MNLADAKTQLRTSYEAAGFDVLEENAQGETLLRHQHPRTRDIILRITLEDVNEYAVFSRLRHTYATEPAPTSIVSPTYREQLVQALDPAIVEADLRNFQFSGRHEDAPVVELDVVSLIFINYFRFDPAYLQLCLDRLYLMPDFKRRTSPEDPVDIRETFARLTTIRVHNLQTTSLARAVEESSGMIETCLFTLAYEWDLPLWLETSWPTSRFERRRQRQEHLEERQRAGDMRLPEARYQGDLLRLYQAGISASVPTQKYLAFYQILEMQFEEASNSDLYERLARQINDPRWKPNQANLRRLIQDVIEHRDAMDDVAALAAVLARYVGALAIDDFIAQTETSAGEPLYSRRRMVFGESIPSAKGEDQTLIVIARRLRAVRDAIVHTGRARHIPLSQTTENITRELPLLKYLAEQVIIATAGT